jgi:aminoglycoside phosphotransferase (APT) family kinase protein
MARSPFTLAAAVTAAVPGAEVVATRPLTAEGAGRYDAAVATLADGREVVIRTPVDESAESELAAEAVALRALTPGVRELLPVSVPEYLGSAVLRQGRATAMTMLPGYQIEAAEIPPGEGAATSIGRTIAAIHALPPSVVRSAGLPERSPEESRADVSRVIDAAAASGRVPVRLTVRWRTAADDDRLWAFESAVGLGGTQATSFLFGDDERDAPVVTGVLDWHGLSIDDPAIDLQWVASAPDAAPHVFSAYGAAAHRAPDDALEVRARLHAELEFARWLLHGLETHRSDVVDDAAGLLESLADGVRDNNLLAGLRRDGETGMDDAIAVLGRVPESAERAAGAGGTAMETDAYDPAELSLTGDLSWDDPDGGAADPSADARDARAQEPVEPGATEPIDVADLHRSTSSSSDQTSSPRSTSSSDT